LKHHILGFFFFGIKHLGFCAYIDRFLSFTFCTSSEKVLEEEGKAHGKAFVGMFYCFGMHTHPQKGYFLLGIWEHLLASKMLLGKGKALI
jgi:hypothetical protein